MISQTAQGCYATVLMLPLIFGTGTAKANDTSKWVGEEDAFKATPICVKSELKIAMPPYSTQNIVSAEDMCGKVYVFTDSDSDERIAFAGGFIFNPVIEAQKYSAARRQLIEMLAKAGGGPNLHLELSSLKSENLQGFLFEQIEMRANRIEGPAGSMTWDVGVREFGEQTAIIFSGVTDLAKQQNTLTDEEKRSAVELSDELSRWKNESLNHLVGGIK